MKIQLRWSPVEKVLRTMEAIAIVITAFVVFQIPGQINEWTSSQNSRSFDLLLRLDEKIKSETNGKILLAITNEKPILQTNGGKFIEEDLDQYLK